MHLRRASQISVVVKMGDKANVQHSGVRLSGFEESGRERWNRDLCFWEG